MTIDKHKIFVHRLVIDFRYQSINCYRLLSTNIDCYRLSVSLIDQAGFSQRIFAKRGREGEGLNELKQFEKHLT